MKKLLLTTMLAMATFADTTAEADKLFAACEAGDGKACFDYAMKHTETPNEAKPFLDEACYNEYAPACEELSVRYHQRAVELGKK